MPFSSQFALSLELTRLVPFILAKTKAVEAIMSLARDLQVCFSGPSLCPLASICFCAICPMSIATYISKSSGSDIIIEEDLVEVFGRSRINGQLASSFRAVVCKSTSTRLADGLTLDTGAGPSVARALAKDQDPYLAMAVSELSPHQCPPEGLSSGSDQTILRKKRPRCHDGSGHQSHSERGGNPWVPVGLRRIVGAI